MIDACAKRVPKIFGIKCLKIILELLPPIAVATSINLFSLTVKASLLISLVNLGTLINIIAKITFLILFPHIATITIASTSSGKA